MTLSFVSHLLRSAYSGRYGCVSKNCVSQYFRRAKLIFPSIIFVFHFSAAHHLCVHTSERCDGWACVEGHFEVDHFVYHQTMTWNLWERKLVVTRAHRTRVYLAPILLIIALNSECGTCTPANTAQHKSSSRYSKRGGDMSRITFTGLWYNGYGAQFGDCFCSSLDSKKGIWISKCCADGKCEPVNRVQTSLKTVSCLFVCVCVSALKTGKSFEAQVWSRTVEESVDVSQFCAHLTCPSQSVPSLFCRFALYVSKNIAHRSSSSPAPTLPLLLNLSTLSLFRYL